MRDPLDRDYTPPALARVLVGLLDIPTDAVVLEPHVGKGAFAYAVQGLRPMVRLHVHDLDPTAPGLTIPGAVSSSGGDFLLYRPQGGAPDWILGNPPFCEAEKHVRHALSITPNVAFLLRQGFLASLRRIPFFEDHPPSIIYHIQGRPGFREGRTNPKTGKPYGTDGSDYIFVVWLDGHAGETVTRWVTWGSGGKKSSGALGANTVIPRSTSAPDSPPKEQEEPMKKLIDPGPSTAGWHRIQTIILCPEKHRLKKLYKETVTEPLVKGSLIHVGLAHLYKQKQLKDKGKDPDIYWTPHEAIAVLAMQKAGESDLWQEQAETAQRVLVEYQEFWGDDESWEVLSVERELRCKVVDDRRWIHKDDPGLLWTKAEKMAHDFTLRAAEKKWDQDEAPSVFHPARYLYTQRADLIVRHRKTGLVYIIDHKTASRPIPSIPKRHGMTGQFLGYRMFGSLHYKETFGGVIVNAIRITDENKTTKTPKFKRPKLARVVNSHEKLKTTIIHAERLIREYTGKPHWPHALQEAACWEYGGCPMRAHCQFAEGEEEE